MFDKSDKCLGVSGFDLLRVFCCNVSHLLFMPLGPELTLRVGLNNDTVGVRHNSLQRDSVTNVRRRDRGWAGARKLPVNKPGP